MSRPEETKLLDLPDGPLGLIYKCLDWDRESKAAMRHACGTLYKSPSINYQIHTLDLGAHVDPASCADHAAKLKAFPKNAALKYLRLMGNTAMMSLSASVLPYVRDVERLLLYNCTLVEGGRQFDFLKLLMPKLSTLCLLQCSLYPDFLDDLAPLVSLEIRYCTGLGVGKTDEVVRSLARLTHLQSLGLHFPYALEPMNLQLVLANVPLRELHLTGVTLLLGVHYSSSTLEELSISTLSVMCPVLAAQDFPRLQAFGFKSIDLSIGMRGLDESMIVSRTRCLAEWVGALPSEARASAVTCDAFMIVGCLGFSASLCASVLEGLLPLKNAFSRIPCLEMNNWTLSNPAMEILAELCSGFTAVVSDEDQGICFNNVNFLGKTPMLCLLRVMPQLQKVSIMMDWQYAEKQLPDDVVAALLAAQNAQRDFCIEIEDVCGEAYVERAQAAYKLLQDQWWCAVTNVCTPPVCTDLRLILGDGEV